MTKPKRKTSKKYIFDNFTILYDIYKKTVVSLKIRFDYCQQGRKRIDVRDLKRSLERCFKKDFEYVERSRHIFVVDMVDEMNTHNGCCSMEAYFIIFDGYEEYIMEHSKIIVEKAEKMFNDKGLTLKLPENKNKYTDKITENGS